MNLPQFLIAWLDRFYEHLEMDLLQIVADTPPEEEQIRNILPKNKILQEHKNSERFLERTWQRGVVSLFDDNSKDT